MVAHPREQAAQPNRRSPGTALVGILLSGAVVDAAVNILSGDYRWRFVTVIAAAGLALAVPGWLARYPPRSPLVVGVTRVLLGAGVVAAGFAAFGSPAVVPWAVAAAALVTAGAVFVPARSAERMILLRGIAAIVCGVAIAGHGAMLLPANLVGGVAALASAVAIAGLGGALLISNGRLAGVAVMALGVTSAGAGVVALVGGIALIGIALIAVGVAAVGLGAAAATGNSRLNNLAIIVSGVVVAAYGASAMAGGARPIGAAFIAVGVAGSGLGVAEWAGDARLIGIAAVASGLAIVGGGASLVADGVLLLGVAMVAGGLATVGIGGTLVLDRGLKTWLRRRWVAVTADPGTVPSEAPSDGSRHEVAADGQVPSVKRAMTSAS